MKPIRSSMMAMSLLAVAGCSLQNFCPGDVGFQYRTCPSPKAVAAAKPVPHDYSADFAAAQRDNAALSDRVRSLESQLADRDRELASLRSSAGDSSRLASQLSSAQGDLDQAKARIADLERQLAASQSAAGDKDRLTSDLAAAQSQLAALQAGAADKDKLAADLAAAQSQLAALQAKAGDKDKLAADLAAAQSQLAALQAGASDKDKLAAESAAAKQRIADLEAQLAAMGSATGDKDKLAAESAAAKQRIADLEAQLAAMGSATGDRDKLAGELSSNKQRVADLEKQLAGRDRELAGLRGELSAEMAKLKEAQRGLIRALKPQIDQKTIAVDLNNERLLINLASGYLFGSGEDELKPAGADALKQVGTILKGFPEYKVAVEGHTDDRLIRRALKKKFPSNKELSEARAANAAKALAEGGLSGATTAGYADTKPVAPNTTDAGRAKNRRVEVRVTK